jgi:hypothetical protein
MVERTMNMAQPLRDRPGKGGFMYNSKGDQATLGFWPEELDDFLHLPGVVTARKDFGELARIAQRYNNFHTTRQLNRLKNITTPEPEPAARAAHVRMEQTVRAQVEANKLKIKKEVQEARNNLKLDYRAGGGLADCLIRHDKRLLLRAMPEPKREEKMKEPDWAWAALETDPEHSGLSPGLHEQLMKQTLRENFDKEFAAIDALEKAVETVETALRGTQLAVEAELAALAEPIVAAPEAAAEKAWA